MKINLKKVLISAVVILAVFVSECITSLAYIENGDIIAKTSENYTVVDINDCAIPTVCYNSELYVPVELLADYGFDVTWINNDHTLIVDRHPNKATSPYDFSQGKYANPMNILSSDIVVYCSGMRVFSINLNGMVCMNADDLAALYGTGGYDAASNRCRIRLNDIGYGQGLGVSVTRDGVYSWTNSALNIVVTQAFYDMETGTYATKDYNVYTYSKGWKSIGSTYSSVNTDYYGSALILGNVIKQVNGVPNSNYQNELNYVKHPSNALREISKIRGYLRNAITKAEEAYNAKDYSSALKHIEKVSDAVYGCTIDFNGELKEYDSWCRAINNAIKQQDNAQLAAEYKENDYVPLRVEEAYITGSGSYVRAHISLKNLTQKNIIGFKLKYTPTNVFGEDVNNYGSAVVESEAETYIYSGETNSFYMDIGYQYPRATRIKDIVITKVVFEDGTSWSM